MKSQPGAVKVGRTWRAPVAATEYAKKKGVSASAARRKGVRLQSLKDFGKAAKAKSVKQSPLAGRAAINFRAIASKKGKYASGDKSAHPVGNWRTEERFSHASPAQLRRLEALDESDWDNLDWDDSMWEGDDGEPIIYYHD